MGAIATFGLSLMLLAAQAGAPAITAVPEAATTGSVVTVLPPDADPEGVSTWSADGGEWCISRLCDWVSPTLTIPAYTDPAYWRADTAGTYTLTWTQGLASASVQVVVSAPSDGGE